MINYKGYNMLPIYKNRKEIPEYSVWKNMRARCNAPCNSHKNYQIKNITVCERWNDFELFYDDMGQRPTSKHSIDRIDNDGNYELSNCRWATDKEQSQNKGIFNKYYKYNDENYLIPDIERMLNVKQGRLRPYLTREGNTVESFIELLNNGKAKRFLFNDKMLTVKEIQEIVNMNLSSILDRLKKGINTYEDMIKPSKKSQIHTVLGITGTTSEILKHFNLSDKQAGYHLRKGKSLEEVILKFSKLL